MKIVAVYMTFPHAQAATEIVQALLEKRLIACANILPSIQSLYWWKGKIENAQEACVIAKTQESLMETVINEVKNAHPYECPCIVSWDITQGHAEYMAWVMRETLHALP